MKTTLLFCLLTTALFGQYPGAGGPPAIKGTIKGSVTDEQTGDPVEYATIVLLAADGTTQINGTLTEPDGSFRLTDIPVGDYQIKATFIGYTELLVSEVKTTKKSPDLEVEPITLSADAVLLDGVEVTGEASLIENRIDKLVYNAEKDATNQGGDASDVLRKVPLLSVDLEGNVSLRGSSNLRILINGRPSTIFATSVADALKGIPSDQIKSVEVITTPSARYDGEGSGGIINIITKKKEAQGFTGTVNSSIGTRQNNFGLNVNALVGRFGINGGVNGFWSWKRDALIDFRRTDFAGGETVRFLEQNGVNESGFFGANGNVGAFYDFNAYNSLNLSGRYNRFARSGEGTTNGFLDNFLTGEDAIFSRFNDSKNANSGFDGTLDYRKTFPDQPDRELILAFQLSGQNSNTDNIVDQSGSLPIYQRDLINTNDGLNLEYTGQLDYVHPAGEKVKIETGLKAVIRRIDSDYRTQIKPDDNGTFTDAPRLTDLFFYDQDVYAAYLSTNWTITENWGLVAGARYEATEIGGEFSNENPDFVNPDFENSYQNFLPSIILSRKLSQFSNLKGSYTKRIQRPSLFFINPFTAISDPNTLQIGNPDLEPEIVDQYELAYNTYIKGVVINGSVYYRETKDLIESFLRVDDDGIASTTTYLNIGASDTYGANFFTSFTIWKKLQLRASVNYGRYTGTGTINGERLERSANVISGNGGGSYKFNDKLRADFFVFGRGPQQTLQGSNPSFSIYGVGLNYDLSERTSLGVRVITPFSEDKVFASELSGTDFEQYSAFTIPFRSFGVSFSHKFGAIDFKAQNRRSRVRNDDQKEGEGNQQF
ncbi:Vitamin B12 transporter BtuB [Neolewinella maritima]|uniref:Vitamin B12 transporter BtuB n=1 Tax=Neolewinella maritima TaxID=1383882 RepID=A0ABN8FAB4_9BACT|nr:outer membrane beta-barrel family protein [Neolewinella maritima]CAH1001686.1 Vitamin B12 transporter BtuB [Neolewinella maritima]